MGLLKPMQGKIEKTSDGLPPIEHAKRPGSIGQGGFAAYPVFQMIEANSRLARIEALQRQQVALLERLVAAAERD